MKKLQKREIPLLKSKRPSETKGMGLERMARGTVDESSTFLFKVRFSRKISERKYSTTKTNEELTEEERETESLEKQRKRILYFRRSDSIPGKYHKPEKGTTVRCIYHGSKKHLFPYAVYDMNWNPLFIDKNN